MHAHATALSTSSSTCPCPTTQSSHTGDRSQLKQRSAGTHNKAAYRFAFRYSLNFSVRVKCTGSYFKFGPSSVLGARAADDALLQASACRRPHALLTSRRRASPPPSASVPSKGSVAGRRPEWLQDDLLPAGRARPAWPPLPMKPPQPAPPQPAPQSAPQQLQPQVAARRGPARRPGTHAPAALRLACRRGCPRSAARRAPW